MLPVTSSGILVSKVAVIFALCGILFAIGPILTNKSGLNGVTASMIVATTMWLTISAYSFHAGVTVVGSKWWLVVLAAILGAIGVLIFNNYLTSIPATMVGQLVIIPILAQLVAFAAYHCWTNGGLKPEIALGFLTALLTAYLLRPQ